MAGTTVLRICDQCAQQGPCVVAGDCYICEDCERQHEQCLNKATAVVLAQGTPALWDWSTVRGLLAIGIKTYIEIEDE